MNWDDMPNTITVDERCLEYWGSEGFGESFFDEIRRKRHVRDVLNLDRVCKRGGYVEDDYVEFANLKFKRVENGIANGSFRFSFTEMVSEGCRDLERSCPVSGIMYFSLRLKDGEVNFQHSPYYDMDGE